MIAKRRSHLHEIVRPEHSFQGWIQTLDQADYMGLEQALQTARQRALQNGNIPAMPVISAAQQLCGLLTMCTRETNWYLRASQEIAAREASFREQLFLLLRLTTELLDTPAGSSNSPTRTHRLTKELPIVPALLAPDESAQSAPSTQRASLPDTDAAYHLTVFTLGTFEVYRDGEPVENWSGRKGAAVFKFLLVNRQRHVHKEELMEIFWGGSTLDSARNNLNVAIHNARQALRAESENISYIVYDDDGYSLNPELRIWVDYDAFGASCGQARDCERLGDFAGAIGHYVRAEQLYQGELFPESQYEPWTLDIREQLQTQYLGALARLSALYFDLSDYAASAATCTKVLTVQPADEAAHRCLMRCYARQGQRHLAQRQYRQCVRALQADGLSPEAETRRLDAQIRSGESV